MSGAVTTRSNMTMYNSKLSVCIKAAGKVLREQKDQVYVPFGSEYSIYLKNLNTVRALVRINLDGVDVTDGTDLVIQPNTGNIHPTKKLRTSPNLPRKIFI